MDKQTLETYDREAAKIAAKHRAHSPNRVHDYILEYFQVGQPTADVGCGSGRDTAWLHQQGFPAIGYDGSTGMLEEARQQFPQIQFESAYLPDLEGMADARYVNVLCNAVLMHIPRPELGEAIANLARILTPEGRVVLSFRPSQEEGEREADGRLFTPYSLDEMGEHIVAAGLRVLVAETLADPVRANTYWNIIVAEK